MNLGVSILYQKSVPEDPGPFSFLKPLDTKVWLSIAIAFAMVSAGYFVVSQVSPDPDGPVSKVLSTIT